MPYFIRTKTNRLKAPAFAKLDPPDISGSSVDWKGDAVAKVGDYVHLGSGVSAGTIGRLVSIKDQGNMISGYEKHYGSPSHWWSGDAETLDGKINGGWLWIMTAIPAEAVQEVKDFYINDGRAGRIKVTW